MMPRRIAPQSITASVAVGLAALSMAWAWSGVRWGAGGELDGWSLLLAVLLGAAIVVAGLFPIHVRYHTKILLTTPPQLILAVLVPPPLAALCAGGAMLVKGLLTKKSRRNTWGDVLTSSGRWVLIGYGCSLVAHSPTAAQLGHPAVLLLTALLMFAADVLTTAVELSPMTREPFLRLVPALVRAGGPAEAVQYLLGILGVLAANAGAWALVLIAVPSVAVYVAFKTSVEMQSSTRLLLESMSDAVDLRDPYTGGHSRRVAELCARILRELNIYGAEADLILSAARVHDIGKIGIPDSVLLNGGILSAAEIALMQTHAARGAELLARYKDFARGAAIVRNHHERWDGRGYPDRLKDYDIPFGARVVAVADAVDAMTSDRLYRGAMTMQQACTILREEHSRQWDPEVVDACLRVLAQPVEQPSGTSLDAVRATPATASA